MATEKARGATALANNCVALVVVETDKLHELSFAAIEKLSDAKKLRSQRAVKEAVKRFGKAIAANPLCLDVWVVPVVGFASTQDEDYEFEPVVAHEGKLQRVSDTYEMVAGEYWVGTPEQVQAKRTKVVATLARKIAEGLMYGDALFALIDEADVDDKVTSMSCDPKTGTVEFEDGPDHEVAKRLPTWVKIKGLTIDAD